MIALFVYAALSASTPTATPVVDKPQLLVMPLEHDAQNVPSATVETVTEALGTELSKEPGLHVLTHSDLSRLAALEGEKAAMGCETDASCLAEIASALGARFVVTGRLSQIEERFVLQLTLLDAQGARSLHKTTLTERSATKIVERLPSAAQELVDAADRTLREGGVQIARRAPEEPTAPVVDPSILTAAGGAVIVGALVTGALSLGAVGFGYVLLTDRSFPIEQRDTYSAFMATGVVGLVVGGLATAAGIAVLFAPLALE